MLKAASMPFPLACSVARRSFTGSVFSPVSCERRAQMDWRASARPSRTCWRVVSRWLARRHAVLLSRRSSDRHFKLDGDADVALSERVVDFAGDAVAFGEDGIEFALGAEEAEAESEEDERRCKGEEEQVEPDRLIEVRPQWKARAAPSLFQTPSLLAA